jgi:hypothetical protein
MFDKNPKATDGDIFVAGKTTEQVVRAIVQAQRDLNETPHPWLVALVARFDRKAERRAA